VTAVTAGPTPGPATDRNAMNADRTNTEWWRTSVVYQVYIRSFADSDGDGLGDIQGLRSKLPYLSALGVDALWINPWYPSPQADAGYDVADFRDIEPAYGTLAQAEALIREVHEAGMRVLLDIVPNHTSSTHRWFRAALAGDAEARARYVFRPGRGTGGQLPPNNWQSNFGGPAWTRTPADGDPAGNPVGDAAGGPASGEWYLHLFAPGQPDLDWSNPQVVAEFEDILRFWFDRGVDGFRIDVAHGLVKAGGLPDAPDPQPGSNHTASHPAWDQDGVHEIYRGWRRVADSYDPPRVFVAEAWVASPERLARYLRTDELQTAFQFDLLRAPFRASVMREVVDEAAATADAVGAPSTWVLSNHDVVRPVTRYARTQGEHLLESAWDRQHRDREAADVPLGLARARAAALLTLALPGVAYVYQGEELGLEEVEAIPDEARQDPTFVQSAGTDPGRDGSRVPIPWSGNEPPYGFSPPDAAAAPWLPQPDGWADRTAAAQEDDPASTLALYRVALAARREHLVDAGPVSWVQGTDPAVLAFSRGSVSCWVNTGSTSVPLPAGRVLVSSASGGADGILAGDSAVWLLDDRRVS